MLINFFETANLAMKFLIFFQKVTPKVSMETLIPIFSL